MICEHCETEHEDSDDFVSGLQECRDALIELVAERDTEIERLRKALIEAAGLIRKYGWGWDADARRLEALAATEQPKEKP